MEQRVLFRGWDIFFLNMAGPPMSAFTDTELEMWKAIARRQTAWEPVPVAHIRGIIERLEAAEYAVMRFQIIPRDHWTSGIEEAYERWIKSAQK